MHGLNKEVHTEAVSGNRQSRAPCETMGGRGGFNDHGSRRLSGRESRELSLCFSAFKLLYSSRSCNRVAHTLAKQVSGDTRT